jgi:hypothetical protein
MSDENKPLALYSASWLSQLFFQALHQQRRRGMSPIDLISLFQSH